MTRTIVFVIGAGRSGSTLLDVLLGMIPTVFAPGELRYLLTRSVQGRELCSCGSDVFGCPIWSPITRDLLRGLDQTQVSRKAALLERFERLRSGWRLLLQEVAGSSRRREEYEELNRTIFDLVFERTGSLTLVDSSKFPFRIWALRALASEYSFKIIHLIRDPRAVAFSWSQRKLRPEITEAPTYMDQHGYVYSCVLWVAIEVACGIVKRLCRSSQYMTIRYEDLVADHVATIERVRAFIGVPSSAAARPKAACAGHSISGNPVRFRGADVRVEADERWKTRMSRVQQLLLWVLTWPLAAANGYRP